MLKHLHQEAGQLAHNQDDGSGAMPGQLATATLDQQGKGSICKDSFEAYPLHIFVDNSNLCYGVQHCQQPHNSNSNISNLYQLQVMQLVASLEQGRKVEEKWVCGSGGGGLQQALQQQWRDCGFKLKWDPRSGPERNVDEVIPNCLLSLC